MQPPGERPLGRGGGGSGEGGRQQQDEHGHDGEATRPRSHEPSGRRLGVGVTGRRCGSGAARRKSRSIVGHLEAQRLQHAVGQLVVAAEALAQARAPRHDAAVGVQLERGFAAVQRRGDVVGGQLQQGGALQRGVAAAREGFLEPGRDLGRRQILVRRRDHQRRAGQDPQDLGHALPRLLHGDAARGHVGAARDAGAVRGELGIELGRRLAAAHRLHVGDQVHQVLDRRLVRPERHRVHARQREPQRELGLGQPGVELMPEEPGGDRLGRRLGEEDALPRHQHVVEPHLSVELVEAAAERSQERVGVARRHLAADDGHAGSVHGHHERRAMTGVIDPRVAADVHVLGVGGAGVHAHLAAQHEPGVGLAHHLQRRPLGRIRAEPIADGGRARAEREEAAGAGDRLAVALGAGDLLARHLSLPDGFENAQRDEVTVPRRVGHVAGGQEDRRGVAASHRAQVGGRPWHREGPRRARAAGAGRRQERVLPRRVAVPVVPGHVLVHHRARGGMNGDVVDQTFPDDPDPASIAQCRSVLVTRPHDARRVSSPAREAE